MEVFGANVELELHHIEERALVDVDLRRRESRDFGPRVIRVVAVLKELAGGDEGREEHPPTAENRRVLHVRHVDPERERVDRVDRRERRRRVGVANSPMALLSHDNRSRTGLGELLAAGFGFGDDVANVAAGFVEVVEGELKRRARGAGAAKYFLDEPLERQHAALRRSRGVGRGSRSPNGFDSENRRAYETTHQLPFHPWSSTPTHRQDQRQSAPCSKAPPPAGASDPNSSSPAFPDPTSTSPGLS